MVLQEHKLLDYKKGFSKESSLFKEIIQVLSS